MGLIRPPNWQEYKEKFGDEFGLAMAGRVGEMLLELLVDQFEGLMREGVLEDKDVTIEDLRANARCYRQLIESIQGFQAQHLLKMKQKEELLKLQSRRPQTELIPGMGHSGQS